MRQSTVVIRTSLLLVAAALVGISSWLLTGPPPEPLAVGSADGVPPLVVRDETPANSYLARGAQLLADGRTRQAQQLFSDVVARRPGDVPAQVGLALSQWTTAGPERVSSMLDQLVRENPGDPYVQLHAGIVQVSLDDARARRSLETAQRLALLQPRGAAFDLARRADDLLHPHLAPGYPLLLVRAEDVATRAARRHVSALRAAVASGDRERSAALSRRIMAKPGAEPGVAVAAAIAAYDKQRPQQAVDQLTRLAVRTGSRQQGVVRVHLALVQLWGGDAAAGRLTLQEASRGSDRWATQARTLLAALDRGRAGPSASGTGAAASATQR